MAVKNSKSKKMKSNSKPAEQETTKQGLVVDERFGHEIVMIPVDQIHPNDYNPNKMSSLFFDELAKDMEETGILSAIVVCKRQDGDGYEIIDGEHRYEIAKLKDMREIPCIVVKGKLAEDRDERIFETMRMNTLRGQTDYKKLKEVVRELAERHDMAEIAERLLYADEHQLRALIEDVRTSLPTEEMRQEFDKAKKDLKTVDDLTLLIKRLFEKHGDTLEYGYMFLDYGGKDSIWIRIENKADYKKLAAQISKVKDYGVTADSAIVFLVQNYLNDEFFAKHKDKLKPVALSELEAPLDDIDFDNLDDDNDEGTVEAVDHNAFAADENDDIRQGEAEDEEEDDFQNNESLL